jgi:hypothetical protein
MSCCIFRCGTCGIEAPGHYFGLYRWGLPDAWLIFEHNGIHIATCSSTCSHAVSARYVEPDITIPIDVIRPESKEIAVLKPEFDD